MHNNFPVFISWLYQYFSLENLYMQEVYSDSLPSDRPGGHLSPHEEVHLLATAGTGLHIQLGCPPGISGSPGPVPLGGVCTTLLLWCGLDPHLWHNLRSPGVCWRVTVLMVFQDESLAVCCHGDRHTMMGVGVGVFCWLRLLCHTKFSGVVLNQGWGKTT